MKVLILANKSTGLYKFRGELLEAMIARNYEVYISVPEGDFIAELEQMGCKFINTSVSRRGVNPLTDLFLLWRYIKIIKRINPDLIITYTIKPNIYGGLAARITQKQYAVNITGLGTAFERGFAVRYLVINLYKHALKKARVIFFENSGNRDVLTSLKCCKKEKTIVLNGAGVNTNLFKYQPYPKNDVFRFLFIGRVMKEKGVDELFESMKRLVSEKRKCSLDVVGPFEDDYEEKISQYEHEGWLHYYGYQKDVRTFINSCDCFVLPSYHEGMANTNLECASSGRPIITSNIPGCKEAVIDGVSGFLCEIKNIESLYQAMIKMNDSSTSERIVMGREGRKYMECVFDKENVVKETLKALML